MADVFDVEGDSVDNPIHENTGSEPEPAGMASSSRRLGL